MALGGGSMAQRNEGMATVLMSSLGQTIKLFISAVSIRLLFSSRHNNNTNAFT